MGSPDCTMIGIVLVARLAAREAGVPRVMITSTGSWTNPTARAGNLSVWPAAKRYSRRRFLPIEIAQLFEPLPQALERRPLLVPENANPPSSVRCLSDGGTGSSRRTADECDEVAPLDHPLPLNATPK